MTANEYQKLASRTINSVSDRDDHSLLMEGVHGIAAEAGEVNGIFAKFYQGHSVEREHLKRELGDVLWYVAEVCTAMSWTLDEVMQANIEKLMKRYPDGFSVEKSLHRSEGDI